MLKSLSHDAGILSSVTTDKDGRFTIEGVGVERLVTLHVSGTGVADTELVVVNRKDFDPKPYNEVKPIMGAGGGGPPRAPVVLHGPDGAVVVEAEKRIRGTVTDVDTGKPRVGAKVTLVGDVFTAAVVPPLSQTLTSIPTGTATVRDALNTVTTYTLDTRGRETSVTRPANFYEMWQLDSHGRVTMFYDALGRATYYEYAGNGGIEAPETFAALREDRP